ncbi:hypothetical protein BC833DRAFT_601855 [Globomyces pollinis-pini]|nr:hypothetical protein BC833DRAFT_601855 [Globomyces pollinis-pini]
MLEEYLDSKLTIHISDGRSFTGFFVCVDHDCNIILSSTTEYSKSQSIDDIWNGKRFIGWVMVPGNHITKILLNPDEKPIVTNARRSDFII